MITTTYTTGLERTVDLISDQVSELPVSVELGDATTRAFAVWELPSYGTDGAYLTVLLGNTLDDCEYLLQPIAHAIPLDAADLSALAKVRVAA
jgi:hypothetical protein